MNGQLVTVKQVKADGGIWQDDGSILPPGFRQFVRVYAATSYAFQGETMDIFGFPPAPAESRRRLKSEAAMADRLAHIVPLPATGPSPEGFVDRNTKILRYIPESVSD